MHCLSRYKTSIKKKNFKCDIRNFAPKYLFSPQKNFSYHFPVISPVFFVNVTKQTATWWPFKKCNNSAKVIQFVTYFVHTVFSYDILEYLIKFIIPGRKLDMIIFFSR